MEQEDLKKLPEAIGKLLSTITLSPDNSVPYILDSYHVYKHMDIESNMLMVEVGD